MFLYGCIFIFVNLSNNGLFVFDSGNGGVVGRYIGELGIFVYYEVILFFIIIFLFKIVILIGVF